MYKLIMGLIPNDWKHLLRSETYEKSLVKISAATIKLLGKEKTSKKSLIKKFTLPYNLIVPKYNKPSKFISWPNLFSVLISG